MYEDVASIQPSGGLLIYPNPASDYFSINTDTEAEISIYNSLGALVYMDRAMARARRVDVSGWPSGIYIVRIASSAVEMQGKVVISH
jgi:hypothetical protein